MASRSHRALPRDPSPGNTSPRGASSADAPADDTGRAPAARAREHGRALRWAQLMLTAVGITAAVAIWALDGPYLLAGAVATAAAGNAGWQISVTVRR